MRSSKDLDKVEQVQKETLNGVVDQYDDKEGQRGLRSICKEIRKIEGDVTHL